MEDPSPYTEEARNKAIQDAGSKANQLASAAGVRLGTPTYINESGGFSSITRTSAITKAAEAGLATIISPGEMKVSITVQVVYGIR